MEKFRRRLSPIVIILAAFAVLATLYSLIVPLFEASDELWHYPMVKYIADHGSLPVQDPENVGPWRQEGSQPPLYYWLGALATFWIDTSDVDVVRHLNPHADNGVATPDGNVNLITHHPEAESFPWGGTALAVHLIRFLSVSLGALTVYLTYRLALELLPGQTRLALMAAAVNAFTPMFVFISGSVNNDNLVVPLCSLALLLIVRIVKGANCELRTPALHCASAAQRGSSVTFYVLRFTSLGLIVGLALLTKESAGGLVLLTALTVAYVAWQTRSWRSFLVGGLASGVPAALIAGWWYLRNWRLYGDPTGQNVFIQVLGQRDVPADLAQLWRERISFIRGYWGNFGGLNVPMAERVYGILDVLLVAAVLGLTVALLRYLRSVRQQIHGYIARLVAWLIVLSWPLLVVLLWITWAQTTWSSQGRLVFSAISVWSLLLALGWQTLLGLGARPRANLTLSQSLRAFVLICVPVFMFAVSLAAPLFWIRPAYARPPALTEDEVAAIRQRVEAVFFHPAGGQLELLGYEAPIEATHPGQSVPVTLYWEAIEPSGQDYSVFVHLVDEHDLVAAQRDAFPGMGTLSTQWLEPGQRWAERRILTLPETAFSPNQVVFEVGLYDYDTGERLAVVDAAGQIAGDNWRFGQVEVLARPGNWPNPISVDFGGQMELVGYDLDRRALRPGETATLTLTWRAQRPMKRNYSISTQFVDRSGVKAAQKDSWPLDGAAPTSLWQPGELVEEPRGLTIFDDAPPGVYNVHLAVYPSDDPEALLVVTPAGGRLQTNHVVLTTVRVLP